VQQAMHIVQENGVKIQKGLRRILNERNIVTDGMDKAAMADRLTQEPDFLSQKGWLEEVGHKAIFFPKFHPEFNSIERYWEEAKKKTRSSCDYSFVSLKAQVPLALNSIPLSKMRKFARKAYRYMDAYRDRDGETWTPKQAEWAVKNTTLIGVFLITLV
jgi:hypothetical protein